MDVRGSPPLLLPLADVADSWIVLRVAFRASDCACAAVARERVAEAVLGVLAIMIGLSIVVGSSDNVETSERDVEDVDDSWDAVEDWRDAGGQDV